MPALESRFPENQSRRKPPLTKNYPGQKYRSGRKGDQLDIDIQGFKFFFFKDTTRPVSRGEPSFFVTISLKS
jgi:hypothetical protein